MVKRHVRDIGRPTDITANTTLARYLRQHQQLPGTKVMCYEGMCGACVVNVTSVNPATGQQESRAVNSCLVPLRAAHGWTIQVTETDKLQPEHIGRLECHFILSAGYNFF